MQKEAMQLEEHWSSSENVTV